MKRQELCFIPVFAALLLIVKSQDSLRGRLRGPSCGSDGGWIGERDCLVKVERINVIENLPWVTEDSRYPPNVHHIVAMIEDLFLPGNLLVATRSAVYTISEGGHGNYWLVAGHPHKYSSNLRNIGNILHINQSTIIIAQSNILQAFDRRTNVTRRYAGLPDRKIEPYEPAVNEHRLHVTFGSQMSDLKLSADGDILYSDGSRLWAISTLTDRAHVKVANRSLGFEYSGSSITAYRFGNTIYDNQFNNVFSLPEQFKVPIYPPANSIVSWDEQNLLLRARYTNDVYNDAKNAYVPMPDKHTLLIYNRVYQTIQNVVDVDCDKCRIHAIIVLNGRLLLSVSNIVVNGQNAKPKGYLWEVTGIPVNLQQPTPPTAVTSTSATTAGTPSSVTTPKSRLLASTFTNSSISTAANPMALLLAIFMLQLLVSSLLDGIFDKLI